MTRGLIPWLMQPENTPIKGARRRAPRPVKTSPPKCDTCRKQWAPWVDHTACGQ